MVANDEKNDEAQYERFKKIARELESDEDEGRFSERLKRIAKQKPKPKDRDKQDSEK